MATLFFGMAKTFWGATHPMVFGVLGNPVSGQGRLKPLAFSAQKRQRRPASTKK
jgi:hypothetical protein